MTDISNKKYFAIIADPVASPTYPATWETAEGPVNPPSTSGNNLGGEGTTDQIVKWTSPNTLGDSAASDDGSIFFIDTRELRVNTINNLGVAATNFLVPDATGVVKLRTADQVKDDLGIFSIPVPDGLVVIGGAVQTGNDIEYDTVWVWRISEVEYSLSVADTITYPVASSGQVRIDLVVGNTSGTITRVAGTEVPSGDPVVAPTVPINTVAFQEVLVDDTGINTVTNFALANYVRYDIDDQDLSPVQRLNARTNIKALSTDTDDERTGYLYNDGYVRVLFPDGPSYNPGTESALKVYGLSASNLTRALFVCISGDAGSQVEVFKVRNRGDVTINHYLTGSVWSGFSIYRNGTARLIHGTGNSIVDIADSFKFWARVTAANRSSIPVELVRRDELYINYKEVVATAGQIDDLAIDDSTKIIDITTASTLTGVVPGTGNEGRLLRIYADGNNVNINNQSTDSLEANRFDIGSNAIVNSGEIYTFIYINSRWHRVT